MRSVDSEGAGLYGKSSPEIGIIWVADIFSQMEGNMHMTVIGEVICAPRDISANHVSHCECIVNWREPVISARQLDAKQYSVQSCQETGWIAGSRTTP